MNESKLPERVDVTGDLMRGDAARYGHGPGLWPTPSAGSALARHGALLQRVHEAAQLARLAQNQAVRCGLGGSALECDLETQAQAAEALAQRVQVRVLY